MNALQVIVVLCLVTLVIARDGEDDNNKCHQCGGSCIAVDNKLLLFSPFYVCIEDQQLEGARVGCKKTRHGVSAQHCLTQQQWQTLVTTKFCKESHLDSMTVMWQCPEGATYLQAIVTCCNTSGSSPPYVTTTQTTEDLKDTSPPTSNEKTSVGVIVIVTVGSVIVVGVVLIVVVKVMCYQRKRRVPKPSNVTSFVNLNNADWGEGDEVELMAGIGGGGGGGGGSKPDFSYVVDNHYTESSD